jgi:hypothetical protein
VTLDESRIENIKRTIENLEYLINSRVPDELSQTFIIQRDRLKQELAALTNTKAMGKAKGRP